jgi:hypothetical protein
VTSNTNSFAILGDDSTNTSIDEKPESHDTAPSDSNKSKISEISRSSTNLSQKSKFSELSKVTTNLSQKLTNSKQSEQDHTTLTDVRFKEIGQLVKDEKYNEFSLEEIEVYVQKGMTMAYQQMEMELEAYKTNTTKDISAHKNKLKSELDTKVQRINKHLDAIDKKYAKIKQNMDKEEVRYITHISTKGNETITSICKNLHESDSAVQKLQQNITQATQTTKNVDHTTVKLKEE